MRKAMAPPPPPRGKFSGSTENISLSRSLVLQFDDIMRRNEVLYESCEDKFSTYVINSGISIRRFKEIERENERLQSQLDKSFQEARILEQKLNQARNLLAEENARARRAEQEREAISQKFEMVRELLLTDNGNTLNNETRQKLKRLEASVTSLKQGARRVMSPGGLELSVVNEIDSTGSILDASDLSFDATCDPTLDESRTRSGRHYKRKSSLGVNKSRSKRSRGSDGRNLSVENQCTQSYTVQGIQGIDAVLVSTRKSLEKIAARRSVRRSGQHVNREEYTPSAPPAEGDICWQAAHNSPQGGNRISDVFPGTPSVQRSHSNVGINARRHVFEQKKVYKFETCSPCGNKFKWGRAAYKCRDCRAIAHPECKDKVPLPCIGPGSVRLTPGKTAPHVLADFTPPQSPMVPGLIVHCVNEIEKRALTEVGIYRVPGSEREVKELKERFLRGKGCPILARIDVHVLCGCVKDFLRSLREPLIPHSMWSEFIQATGNPDQTDGDSAMYQAISKLPAPNRDTLAFMILHLKRVAEVNENLMNVSNLAKILGPTIIGYSSPNPLPANLVSELGHMSLAMERLMELEVDYWKGYIDVEDNNSLYPRSNNILSPCSPEMFKPIISDTGLTPKTSKGRQNAIRESASTFFSSPMLA